MAKKIFEHEYKNGTVVTVYETGVTIWDNKASRWVVDASCIADDNDFSIGAEIFARANTSWGNPTFPAFYEKRRKWKRKPKAGGRGREWWILNDNKDGVDGVQGPDTNGPIKVIEYSAYEQLKREVERLTHAAERHRELAAERLAQLQAANQRARRARGERYPDA